MEQVVVFVSYSHEDERWLDPRAGRKLIPILLEPCPWEELDFLSSRQMLPGKPTPLIDYIDSDARWVHVRDEILRGLIQIVQRLRPRETGSGPPPIQPITSTATGPQKPISVETASDRQTGAIPNSGDAPSSVQLTSDTTTQASSLPPAQSSNVWCQGMSAKQALRVVVQTIMENSPGAGFLECHMAILQHIAKLHGEGGERFFDLTTGEPFHLLPQQPDGSPKSIDAPTFTAFWLIHNSPDFLRKHREAAAAIKNDPLLQAFSESGLFCLKSQDDRVRVACSVTRTFVEGGDVQAEPGFPRKKIVRTNRGLIPYDTIQDFLKLLVERTTTEYVKVIKTLTADKSPELQALIKTQVELLKD